MSRKTSRINAADLAILVVAILVAFGLRVYHLGASPLRGDEAFAVRYWAAPPADVLRDLAGHEPHPLGTFFSFWAWKSLVGDSEFAMRMLPALINLLGVPAMYAIVRRLFRAHGKRDSRQLARLAAFLWAINPNLIWHSQDVRDYAMWAGLSALSVALLLRAVHRSRRIDWILYIVGATLSLYVFFLEAFMILIHGLYILICQRGADRIKALRAWLISLVVIGVLLIPWFAQIWALAHSGYRGAAAHADLLTFITTFWQSLALGEVGVTQISSVVTVGFLLMFLFALVTLWRRDHRIGTFLAGWLVLPSVLLIGAATRLDVFLPRYLIALTPALLVVIAWFTSPPAPLSARREGELIGKRAGNSSLLLLARATRYVILLPYAVLILFSFVAMADTPKAPNWYALRDYLRANATSADTVIMTSLDPSTGNTDPAFAYYYSGPAKVIALPHPGFDIAQTVKQEIAAQRAVWFIVVGSDTQPITDALTSNGTLISDDGVGGSFLVRQYRAKDPKPAEIENPLAVTIGSSTLAGYALSGGQAAIQPGELTVMLFWQDSVPQGLTAFVHLIGPPKADGSPLWAQQDHPPASPGHDVYRLDLANVPPGTYSIEIGLYDSANKRQPIRGSTTDSRILTTVRLPR